jgi:hypothetical protein
MSINYEVGRMCNKTGLACFKVPLQHMPGQTEKNHKNLSHGGLSPGKDPNQTLSTNLNILTLGCMNDLKRLFSTGIIVKKLYLWSSPTLQFILFPLILFQKLEITELPVDIIHLGQI